MGGRKLSAPCRAARNMASSLDKVHAKLSLPKKISENRFVEMATEATKIFFLPYSRHKYLESKPTESVRDYEIEADVDGRGRYLTVKAKGNREKIVVRDYPLRWDTKELLPICTKESLGHKVLQKMTRHAAPSTCLVEPREITTFDGKTYRYTVNDCEHIIFAEESSRPRIFVSNKKSPSKHVVSMVVDGEKYGVEVIADGERLMVRTNELVFRNRATGLCGDLNGEETADLKTGRECILSESELTGLRFMLEDGKCRGIPEEKKTQIEREEERCVKEEVKPTIVSGIVTPKRSNPTERRHLIEKQGQKSCFSENMIRSCNQSTPKEVRFRQVGYVCMNGPKANVMERRVKSGDRIPEFQNMPTDFSQTVYEPSQC